MSSIVLVARLGSAPGRAVLFPIFPTPPIILGNIGNAISDISYHFQYSDISYLTHSDMSAIISVTSDLR